jgi:hypothetical protein
MQVSFSQTDWRDKNSAGTLKFFSPFNAVKIIIIFTEKVESLKDLL